MKRYPLNRACQTLLLSLFLSVGVDGHTSPAREDDSRRLQRSMTVQGIIGGESHDAYVIRVRANQRLSIQLSWRLESDPETGKNRAEFWVSNEGCNGNSVVGEKAMQNGTHWTAKALRTQDYYVCVVAYPTAHYKLRVEVR